MNELKFAKLFRKHPELMYDVEFVEKVRSFLRENPHMIDKIKIVVRELPRRVAYIRLKREYKKPSPAQAKVWLTVGEPSHEHFGSRGFRDGLPIIAHHVKEAFKDYAHPPKPPYSKKMQKAIAKAKEEAKAKPTLEKSFRELAEVLKEMAQVVKEKD